ncbi:hypothetical protein HDU93_006201 [Gonapodya sp. JEL0774]|nr:hypothetical protein HDU93_006201 [Gonapodya sp. JEL0774]
MFKAVGKLYRTLYTWNERKKWDKNPDGNHIYNPNRPRKGGDRHSAFDVMWHKALNYQYTPVKYINNMGLGELLTLIALTLVNIVFMVIPIPFSPADLATFDLFGQITEVSTRAAWIGTANAFFIALTATRNSMLELITGISFERMIMYHRWLGRLFSIHAVLEFKLYDTKPFTFYGFSQWAAIFNLANPNNIYAVIAYFFLVFMIAFSHSNGVDRIIRNYRSRSMCDTLAVQSFPDSDIIKLVLQPVRFNYQPGQYLFLNVPQLHMGKLMWNPFSISSAPDITGRDKRITMHIKDNGDFTKSLVTLVKEREAEVKKFGQIGADAPRLTVFVDGGYGYPGERFEDLDVVVMVAGGIGVTPMIAFTSALVQRLELGLPTATRDIYFWWFVPSLGVYRSLAPEILDLRKRVQRISKGGEINLDIRIYVTRSSDKAKKELDLYTAAEKGMITMGRGDVDKLMLEVKNKHITSDV